jgi:23S rRNA (uracil1939-C5)-methyltransferase
MIDSSSTIVVQLDKLTYGGDAMGRLPDGRAVFIPFGLPGERVRVRLVEERGGFARGEVIEILEPSPDRIRAKCIHFGTCGGCHYQDLPHEKQLIAKQEILRDQLARIGRIASPNVLPAVPSPAQWNYRNHVQFHLTEKGEPGYVNAAGRAVFAISECHLPDTAIDAAWRELQFESNTDVQRVSLRSGVEGELLLILESDSPEPPELEIESDLSVVHMYEDHPLVLAGGETILARVLEHEFRVSAGSFFQVNTGMAEKMVRHVMDALGVSKQDTLLDLYCGVGLFSKFLAGGAKRVIGVEASPSACEDYAANLDEFDNVELYEGRAEEILPAFPASGIHPDLVLVDPPRAGIDRAVLDALLDLGARRIIYVSCDPATLARDARRLIEGGYRLGQVTPFDLFPQTYHIESISVFEK